MVRHCGCLALMTPLASKTEPNTRNLSFTLLLLLIAKGHMLSKISVVAAADEKDVVSCELDGEVTLMNLRTGNYHGLDPVGSFIWNLLHEPKSVGTLHDALLQRYDVEPARAEYDLLSLLEQLASAKLITVQEGIPSQTVLTA